jgi:hypothetical protein
MHDLHCYRLVPGLDGRSLPDAGAGESEPEYLERIASGIGLLLHNSPMKPRNGTTPVEVRDLLTHDRRQPGSSRRVLRVGDGIGAHTRQVRHATTPHGPHCTVPTWACRARLPCSHGGRKFPPASARIAVRTNHPHREPRCMAPTLTVVPTWHDHSGPLSGATVVENLHHGNIGFRSGGAANFAAPLSSDRRHRLATAILGRGHAEGDVKDLARVELVGPTDRPGGLSDRQVGGGEAGGPSARPVSCTDTPSGSFLR